MIVLPETFFILKWTPCTFTGPDYDVNVIKKYKVAYNLGCVKKATPNKIERVHYIFLQALKAKDLGNRKIRIYYINTRNFTVDDRFLL